MLIKILSLLVLIIPSLNAQTVPGQVIKAETFNSSTFNVGDIRQAMLTELQFQLLNGPCWVMMKGQSVNGSEYASLSGENSLPNAEGTFLRTSGGGAGGLTQIQEAEIKTHTHLQNPHYHTDGFPRAEGNYPYNYHGALNGTFVGSATYVSTQANGVYVGRYAYTTNTVAVNQNTGGESRPKNLTINSFVKINSNCGNN